MNEVSYKGEANYPCSNRIFYGLNNRKDIIDQNLEDRTPFSNKEEIINIYSAIQQAYINADTFAITDNLNILKEILEKQKITFNEEFISFEMPNILISLATDELIMDYHVALVIIKYFCYDENFLSVFLENELPVKLSQFLDTSLDHDDDSDIFIIYVYIAYYSPEYCKLLLSNLPLDKLVDIITLSKSFSVKNTCYQLFSCLACATYQHEMAETYIDLLKYLASCRLDKLKNHLLVAAKNYIVDFESAKMIMKIPQIIETMNKYLDPLKTWSNHIALDLLERMLLIRLPSYPRFNYKNIVDLLEFDEDTTIPCHAAKVLALCVKNDIPSRLYYNSTNAFNNVKKVFESTLFEAKLYGTIFLCYVLTEANSSKLRMLVKEGLTNVLSQALHIEDKELWHLVLDTLINLFQNANLSPNEYHIAQTCFMEEQDCESFFDITFDDDEVLNEKIKMFRDLFEFQFEEEITDSEEF